MSRLKPDEQFARLLEISSPIAAGADPTMGSMANLANALRAAGAVAAPAGPDPAFRAALRQRLVAVATVQTPTPAAATTRIRAISSVRHRAHRRIAALAGTVAIATSVVGVGVAAARSLPGDPFYGVKRATEAVQLWTAHGDQAKGKRHLEFAQTRLAEARALPADSSHIASTLAAMNAQTKAGSSELISAYRSSKSTAPLTDLVVFSRQQYLSLLQLAKTLPTSLRAQDLASLGVLTTVVKQVHNAAPGVCLSCLVSRSQRPKGQPTTTPVSPSANPSKTPNPRPSRSASKGTSAPRPTRSTSPIQQPTSIIPTGIIPTGIIPTKLIPTLPPLLHLGKHKHPLPAVSTLLKGLGL
jgi:hypothetical protein